jgi:hypothetical protein
MVCLNDFVYDYKAFNATVVLRHTLLFYKLFSDDITLKILTVHNEQNSSLGPAQSLARNIFFGFVIDFQNIIGCKLWRKGVFNQIKRNKHLAMNS